MDSTELAALVGMAQKAEPPINRARSLGHPEGMPWTPGTPGLYDGTYIVEFCRAPQAFFPESKSSGPIVRSVFRIVQVVSRPDYTDAAYDAGDVDEGSVREHVLFPKPKTASASEFQGLITERADFVRGVPGTFTAEEAADLLGPKQAMDGVQAKLVVQTLPQQKDTRKGFTHFRYRYLSTAASRVESMPITVAPPTASPSVLEAVARAKAGFVPPEVA